MDNQVLKRIFTKSELSCREACWLGHPGMFGITALTLVKEKFHVLGDALSRLPQYAMESNNIINNMVKEEA